MVAEPKKDEHAVADASSGGSARSAAYGSTIADLYARYVLDALVEIAYAVAKDFVVRPEYYKGINEHDAPSGISDLWVVYGSRSSLLNHEQRQVVNTPLFGAPDTDVLSVPTDKFHVLRKSLFDACVKYSERTVTDADTPLSNSVVSALGMFRTYLNAFKGASVALSYTNITNVSNSGYRILRHSSVSRVFGISGTIAPEWPIGAEDNSESDAHGALLIRSIGERLNLPSVYTFTEETFHRLQRIARNGNAALQIILKDPSPDADTVATPVYTWAVAVSDYGAH